MRCRHCGLILKDASLLYQTNTGTYCCAACAALEARMDLQITAVRELAEQIARDELTGVTARSQLERVWGEMAADAPRAILFVDIDHFKAINDQWGHAAGDQVLAEVARRMVEALRPQDWCLRYGGEEFLIVLGDVGCAAAVAIANRVRRAVIAAPISGGTWTVAVSVSIGVTVGSGQTAPDHWIREADAALYEAKKQGRNRVVQHCALDHRRWSGNGD